MRNKIVAIILIVTILMLVLLAISFLKVADNAKLKKSLILEQKKVDQLTKEISNKKSELDSLSKKIAELSYPEKLRSALSQAQNTISDMSNELNVLRVAKNTLEQERRTLNIQIKNNTQEINNILKELESAKSELSSLGRRNRGKLDNSDSDDVVDDLVVRDQPIRSRSRAVRKRENIISKQGDGGLGDKKVQELQGLLNQKTEEMHRLDIQLSEARKRNDELFSEVKNINEKAVRLEILNSTLEGKIAQLSSQVSSGSSDKDQKIKALEEELKNSKAQEINALNNELQKNIIAISSSLDEKEKRIRELEAQITKPVLASDEEVYALRHKLVIQKEELGKLNTLYEQVKSQLATTTTVLARREEEIKYKNREVQELKFEISSLTIKISGMEASLNQSQDAQKMAEDRLNDITNLNRTLQQRLGEATDFLSTRPSKAAESHNPNNELLTAEPSIMTSDENSWVDSIEKRIQNKEKADEARKKIEILLQDASSK